MKLYRNGIGWFSLRKTSESVWPLGKFANISLIFFCVCRFSHFRVIRKYCFYRFGLILWRAKIDTNDLVIKRQAHMIEQMVNNEH